MISIGDKLPSFSLEGFYNGKIKTFSLKDFQGKWWILFFYPKDFTFVCPTEVLGFQKQWEEFKSQGADVAGVNCDPPQTHEAWAKELQGLAYPLLSDTSQSFSKALGVFHEEEKTPARATFIIDPEGRIQYLCVTHRNVGRSVNETLRVLSALKTGQMCPADWKPGEETFDVSHQY